MKVRAGVAGAATARARSWRRRSCRVSTPAGGIGLARQRRDKVEAVSPGAQSSNSSRNSRSCLGPRRKQQQHRHVRLVQRPVPRHRHQGHDAGAAADQQDRPAVASRQTKWPPSGPLQLDLVADLRDIVEERRHLAVVEPFDRQFDRSVVLRRRGDRIAALRPIAVRRRQPDLDMLPGDEGPVAAGVEKKKLAPRRSLHDAGDGARCRQRIALSRPCSAARATGRRRCGSRAVPRNPSSSRLRELQPVDPLCRLPEIEMRHQQPRRAAMVGA